MLSGVTASLPRSAGVTVTVTMADLNNKRPRPKPRPKLRPVSNDNVNDATSNSNEVLIDDEDAFVVKRSRNYTGIDQKNESVCRIYELRLTVLLTR